MNNPAESWHGCPVTWADVTLHCHRTPIQEGATLQQGNTVLSDAHLEGVGGILGPEAVTIPVTIPLILTPFNSSLSAVDVLKSLCFPALTCSLSDQDLPLGTGLELNTAKYS